MPEAPPEVDMSEEQIENQEVETSPEVDYKAELEQLRADFDAVLAKNKELLGETKKAKEAKRAIEAEDRHRAEQNGEFERLLKMEQEEKAKVLEQLNSLKQNVFNEKINTQAHKLANELKAIPESADILADIIAKELKSITDDKGEVSETALKSLKHQFSNDDKYKPLLMGNQSNGGGATGAKNGVQQDKIMNRTDFDKLPAMRKMEFMRDGGKLLD